jgi:tetratricopeptide (TPR) repeat protein
MRLRFTTELSYRAGLALFTLVVAFAVHAQEPAASKGVRRLPAPYAREESGIVSPALAQREAALRENIARQPESSDLLYQLAVVLRQEGKPRESLDWYTRGARSRTPTAGELRSVALDYVLLNDYEDAIRWLERALKMEPKNVDVLYSLGRCFYSKDRYLDAGKMYERVLTIEPTHLKAEENLGLVFDATNHPEEAEEALRKAAAWAASENTDEWPFLDLGGFLLDRDRAAEAVDPLRTAVRIRPTCAVCHEKLGRALLAANDLPGSIAELEEATRLDANDPKAHFELGRALRQAGQAERAKQEFATSQKLYSAHSQE